MSINISDGIKERDKNGKKGKKDKKDKKTE